jgi:hypothetical protein
MHRCFAAQIYRNALCDPHIPLDAKPQVRRNLSRCAFYGNRIRPTQAWKIVHDIALAGRTGMHYVTHRSHRMQKTEVRSNVPWCAFSGNRTAPTRASKIVHRRFAPPAHQNALHDPHISLGAKTQVWHNVCMVIKETAPGPPELGKECLDISRPRCIGMNYVTHRSH